MAKSVETQDHYPHKTCPVCGYCLVWSTIKDKPTVKKLTCLICSYRKAIGIVANHLKKREKP